MRRVRAWLALAERAVILGVLILRAAWLYGRTALHNRGTWRTDSERLTRSYARFGASFVAVAVRFRGGLIKLGQLGSLRSEVIPEEVTRELARLQDRVPPHPFAEIAAQIETELGAPLGQRFSWFDPEPLAAASLGQVHRARDLEGTELAVKLLYPGVERSVAVDLAMTHLGLWLFDFVAVADLMRVYREIRASLLGEMDYEREGRAAETIARNLASDPALFAKLRLPAIHWKTTTRRVLSMEYIEGTKITDREALVARGIDPEQAVVTATRAFLHMIFRDGFFHCDPHPGNLLVDLDGRVAIVDFGMNKQIEPEVL
ncbi:MAG TPA: AarF/ABC1/UbiB kinase family protein, partial [Myxococcota bacterium]|nr:AarF/ABC1/UbiB kinase family protein [Myxococcota bacterium]